jgi:ABC-type phosphate transport system permease subunit
VVEGTPRRWRAVEDDPPVVRRSGGATRVLSIVTRGLTGVGAVLVGLFWLLVMSKAENAIQGAAISAMAATLLIGLDVVARAATEVLDHVRALQG